MLFKYGWKVLSHLKGFTGIRGVYKFLISGLIGYPETFIILYFLLKKISEVHLLEYSEYLYASMNNIIKFLLGNNFGSGK